MTAVVGGTVGGPERGIGRGVGNRISRRHRVRHCAACLTDDAHLALRERNSDAVLGKETPDIAVDGREHATRAARRIFDPETQLED
ncbi:hypothetical protein OKW40_002590 [Paraburkholderia sp. RAU6.4a]